MPSPEEMQKLAEKMPGGLPPGMPGAPGLPPTMPGMPSSLPPNFPGTLSGLGPKVPGLGGFPGLKKK
jgi:signal recognition particle subunit SRP54